MPFFHFLDTLVVSELYKLYTFTCFHFIFVTYKADTFLWFKCYKYYFLHDFKIVLKADILVLSGSFRASLVAQLVKNQPAVQETQVRSLGQEDPLEKGVATHSSILDCSIPWTEEPGKLYSQWGLKESDTTEQLTLSLQVNSGKREKVFRIHLDLCAFLF